MPTAVLTHNWVGAPGGCDHGIGRCSNRSLTAIEKSLAHSNVGQLSAIDHGVDERVHLAALEQRLQVFIVFPKLFLGQVQCRGHIELFCRNLNWSRRENLKAKRFEFGVMITIQAFAVGLLHFSDILINQSRN